MKNYPLAIGTFPPGITFGIAEQKDYYQSELALGQNYYGPVYWCESKGRGIEIRRYMTCKPNCLTTLDEQTWQWNKKIPEKCRVKVGMIRFISGEEHSFDSLQIIFDYGHLRCMRLKDFLEIVEL